MASPANDLHDLALSAEQNLEQLATGLAGAQADPNAVKAVTQMASVLRKIVSALGGGGAADAEDTKEAPETPGEAPDTEDVAEGPEAAGPQRPVHRSLDTAAEHLHQAMVAHAKQRQAADQVARH